MALSATPFTPIQNAFLKQEYCDLTITCGDFTIGVHKVLVCSASTFFEKAVKFPGGKEAAENTVIFPDDDPDMIRRLVAFLYTGDYEPTNVIALDKFRKVSNCRSEGKQAVTYHARKDVDFSLFIDRFDGGYYCSCLTTLAHGEDPSQQSQPALSSGDGKVIRRPADAVQLEYPLTIHADMYALGDKYEVQGLSTKALDKFKKSLQYHWNSEDFINATQIAYTTTPESNRGLRDAVVRAIKDYFGVDVGELPGVEESLATIDKLSFLLMKSLGKKRLQEKVSRQETWTSLPTQSQHTQQTSDPASAAPRTPAPQTQTIEASTIFSTASQFVQSSRPGGSLFGGPSLFGGSAVS